MTPCLFMKTRVISVPEDTYLAITMTSDRLCVPSRSTSTLIGEIIVGSLDAELGNGGLRLGLKINPKKAMRPSMWVVTKTVHVDERVAARIFQWARALKVATADLYTSCAEHTVAQMRTGRMKGFTSIHAGYRTSTWPHEIQPKVDRLRAQLLAAVEKGDFDGGDSDEEEG